VQEKARARVGSSILLPLWRLAEKRNSVRSQLSDQLTGAASAPRTELTVHILSLIRCDAESRLVTEHNRPPSADRSSSSSGRCPHWLRRLSLGMQGYVWKPCKNCDPQQGHLVSPLTFCSGGSWNSTTPDLNTLSGGGR